MARILFSFSYHVDVISFEKVGNFTHSNHLSGRKRREKNVYHRNNRMKGRGKKWRIMHQLGRLQSTRSKSLPLDVWGGGGLLGRHSRENCYNSQPVKTGSDIGALIRFYSVEYPTCSCEWVECSVFFFFSVGHCYIASCSPSTSGEAVLTADLGWCFTVNVRRMIARCRPHCSCVSRGYSVKIWDPVVV